MGKYEYKYNYSDWYLQIQIQIQVLSHQKNKIDMFIYMKAIKVWQLMQMCAIKYHLCCLVYKKIEIVWFHFFLWIQIKIYSDWQKKGRLQIQIYLVWIKRENTNTNIFGMTKKGKYKYK